MRKFDYHQWVKEGMAAKIGKDERITLYYNSIRRLLFAAFIVLIFVFLNRVYDIDNFFVILSSIYLFIEFIMVTVNFIYIAFPDEKHD